MTRRERLFWQSFDSAVIRGGGLVLCVAVSAVAWGLT